MTMWRSALMTLVLLGSFLAGPSVATVQACPMCKLAAETDNLQPRAYMYSILFMLSAMGGVVTVVSVGLYKMSRREQADLEDAGYGHVLGKPSRPSDQTHEIEPTSG